MSDLPALAKQNKKEEIVVLLRQGANVNEQNECGQTAFWWSCFYNDTETAEILLKNNNINVNLRDNYGISPFYYACGDNSYAIVSLS